ncbi:MAG TPA: hypothetical protein VGM82_09765 [Gemmatimonadaceae bacterium]|jgi:hypothetical protein
MFLAGPNHEIPLCLDCNLKLQTLQTRQLAEMERALNHTVDQMELIAGFPLGGKFPPRPQPAIIAGGAVLNNIRIADSQIGVLNTGSIGSIDAAITVVRESGSPDLASALKSFTENVAKSPELTTEQRRDLVDLISTLATEAASPPVRRKPAVARAIAVDIAQLISGAASLAQLWSSYAPAVKAFFGIP